MDGIYTRQSVDKKDSISIETQVDMCIKEVTPGQDYKIYSDKGYSGSNTNRLAFQEMLEDIKTGKIKRVIVYRLDRMSRSLLDFAKLIDFLDEHGASFVSTQEKFDTGSPIGRAMLNITMVFAQLERETIQIRIRDNYYSRGEKGMYLGGPPPFGFSKTQTEKDGYKLKYLIPDAEQRITVERMFSLYGDELMSLGEVAQSLNREACPTATGKRWNSSRVSLTLRNPIYAMSDVAVCSYYKNKGCKIASDVSLFAGTNGCYLYGRRSGNERKYTSVEGHTLSLAPSAGIIEPELFLKCQRRLDRNTQIDNSSRGRKTWLTGLVKCAECGYAVIPKSSNNGRYEYFYCSGHIAESCGVSGKLGDVRGVEAAVEKRLMQVADKYKDLQSETERRVNRDINELLAKIESYDAQIEKLIDMSMTAEKATMTYLNERIGKLDAEKSEAKAKLEKARSEEDAADATRLYALIERWPELNVMQKNEIASLFIDRIEISCGEIRINWKYSF